MVHLYGRFLRKTFNSKLAVDTVSQLRLWEFDISSRSPLPIKMNSQIDTGNGMVQVAGGT